MDCSTYNQHIKLKIFLFSILISITFPSCKKDNSEFPYTTVNTYLYPSNSEFDGLHFPGGHAYINGGINGIIIYHSYMGEYIAYDRACTNDPLEPCEQVYLDADLVNTLSCHCCESQYLLLDGGVIKGPAKHALQRYQTTFDGVKLNITN